MTISMYGAKTCNKSPYARGPDILYIIHRQYAVIAVSVVVCTYIVTFLYYSHRLLISGWRRDAKYISSFEIVSSYMI